MEYRISIPTLLPPITPYCTISPSVLVCSRPNLSHFLGHLGFTAERDTLTTNSTSDHHQQVASTNNQHSNLIMRPLSTNYHLLQNATKGKENGNCAAIIPPRNNTFARLGYNTPLCWIKPLDKLCVKGAVHAGHCATASWSFLCAAPLQLVVYSIFTAFQCPRDLLVTCFMVLKSQNAVVGIGFSECLLHFERLPA